ncbi:aspartate kinase [Roseobacter sp. HKCCD9010]|uniref:aspartate kinase n=1 Tax=unclassified Roseobacter TaxID=196798 RepID=UPI001491398F|nr:MULTISPECIES: aspartate kinase [unclassified Roseobacter]MBF9049293.1 aspartate kinase [Rhodobacterales bacterium HKCCD4356]NNV11293.1 aspartate kinase [Roseobacter sp. HKCCD7357]NNV15477.1 aspartate kinase [Roseobacter sp. HKCCD8768]NNV24937.1 aspartate kinase [Roseobacter sp. HKCCD8192]NNV29194.1 aspartate kinase [Roseobacter sp. HKCCD9061]
MPLLVMKFGGTSVATLDRIRRAAKRVGREVANGYDVIVIVSAMSGETNKLVGYVDETSPLFDAREYDAVVSSGENVTAGLMALTLQEMDVPARSWQGWQVPLKTTSAHAAARIEEIPTENINAKFDEGMKVAVVAGFQGISPEGRITTLGRGGSDTTAVAFAAAFGAERCDIYTDVDGVYTTDPRITSKARKLEKIAFEEMLELASLGAKVLQTRSVELAMRYNVRLRVLSSFEDNNENAGTLVCAEEDIVESNVVAGVAYSRDEAKMTLVSVADRPGIAAAIFGPLAEAGVNVDMIVQNIAEEGRTDMTFSCPTDQVKRAEAAMNGAKEKGEINFHDLVADTDVCKVSIVGIGMRSHAGVASKMFSTLRDEGINIKVITTSEIKVSVLVDRKYMELAVQALHDAFGLEQAA